MHLLTLKRLTLHFTNSLINVALKFYVVSFTHAISNFKSINLERPNILNLHPI